MVFIIPAGRGDVRRVEAVDTRGGHGRVYAYLFLRSPPRGVAGGRPVGATFEGGKGGGVGVRDGAMFRNNWSGVGCVACGALKAVLLDFWTC